MIVGEISLLFSHIYSNISALFCSRGGWDGYVIRGLEETGGTALAKNTIDAIREAEAASQEREKEAKAKAAQLVEDARAAARTIVSEKLSKLKAEDQKTAEKAAEENAALIERAQQEVASEIEALRDQAGSREALAVDAVLRKLIA